MSRVPDSKRGNTIGSAGKIEFQPLKCMSDSQRYN